MKNYFHVLQLNYFVDLFLANFDDKFSEPIIKFTLSSPLSMIFKISGSAWGIVSLGSLRFDAGNVNDNATNQ